MRISLRWDPKRMTRGRTRNLAIRSKGPAEDEDARRSVQNFGHEGDGFWFQVGGGGEDNIACGHAGIGRT